MILAVTFLGAMQVIGTEAQDDKSLIRELSEKVQVAQASSGVSAIEVEPLVTSSIDTSESAPLESRGAAVAEVGSFAPAPLEAAAKTVTEPEASPQAGAQTAAKEEPDSPCVPDAGGAPFCIYAVQEGDTLWGIAENLGLAGTSAFSGAELIALSNGLNDAQNWLITPGQAVRVPVASGVIHTVGESDTLSVLAELYGITPADIILANALVDPNSVVVGQTLLIPSPNLWPLSGPLGVSEDAAAVTADETAAEAPEEGSEGEAAAAEDEATATEAPEPTATPEVTAEASAEAARAGAAPASANPSVAEIRDQFAAGYIAGGGPPQYIEFILSRVIACESGYNLRAFNPAGPFYGLMQFLPQTWANTGGGDWFDAWQQGHNTGVLLRSANPASQWPVCWR